MAELINQISPGMAPLSTDLSKLAFGAVMWNDFLKALLANLSGKWRNDFCPAPELIEKLTGQNDFEVVSEANEVIAFAGEGNHTVPADGIFLSGAWELLRVIETYLPQMHKSCIKGWIHPAAVVDGKVELGENSRILPGVYIEGNCIIGKNCKIGPNCYLRGNVIIGDNCHIGQAVEIKNSIINSFSNVPHLSYVGDSVIGSHVNLGAGTIISNFRHDGKNHRTMIEDVLIDTGRRKFGSIIGDGVHTGINTSVYPGRKIFAGVSTRPGAIVDRDLKTSR